MTFEAFDGTPVGDRWSPIEVQVLRDEAMNKDLPAGDYPSLIPYVPVASKRAVQALEELLKGNGEILPLRCREGEYFAFNVTRMADVLDEVHSEVTRFEGSGRIMRIVRHHFREEGLEYLDVFKLPQLRRSHVYVTDRFVRRVAETGLLGFDFEQVWPADAG